MIDQVTRHPLAILDDEGDVLDFDGWGVGCLTCTMNWEDVGAEVPKRAKRLILQPPAYTLPKEYAMKFLGAIQLGRQSFYRWAQPQDSIRDSFGPGWRWLPWTAREVFKLDFDEAKRKLTVAQAWYRENRADVLADVEESMLELAVNAEKQLLAVRAELPFNFRSRVVRDALERVPSPEQIDEIGMALRRPSHTALEAFKSRQVARREPMTDDEIKEYAGEELLRMELAQHREMLAMERQAKRQQIEEKLRAEREFFAQEFEPLRESMAYVRGQVVKDARELLGTIQKHGFLPGASAEKVEGMLTWFRASNVSNDAEMETLIEKLTTFSRKPAKGQKRDVEAVTNSLVDIVRASRESMIESAHSNRIRRLLV